MRSTRAVPAKALLLLAASLLFVAGCGVSYPIEVTVEVVGEGGLEKATVAVYVATETGQEEQDLPYETSATISQQGEAVTAKAAMVDGEAGHRLTIRILTNTETVATETSEDPGLTLTATWAPE